MRIISIIATMAVAVIVFPQHAAAQETINTNTKIELPIQKNILIAYKNAYSFEGTMPLKSSEDVKNEHNNQILARWKDKQGYMWKNLPQGKFTILATNYTSAADECGKSDGLTASGIKVHLGTIACPPQYPFGVKLNIDGYGTFVCEDRGGAIKVNHFDIYVETKKEAFAFGKRNLTAEIVD